MSIYTPNRWVILSVEHDDDDEIMYRVFGGWSGGYLDGDSWRLGSPIVGYQFETKKTDSDEKRIELIRFFNESGSEYLCSAYAEGFNGIMTQVYSSFVERKNISVKHIPWEDIIEHNLLEEKTTGE